MKTIKYLFLQYVCWYFMYRASGIIHHRHLMRAKYTGPLDNISIAQLKQRFANITTPQLIEDKLVIKGIVTGNDESGNIYKQIFVQDASGGIYLGVDQNSIYASYRVGQEVYIQLKDLFMVKYGGELQIGMGSTNANRISWEMFKAKAFRNSGRM